MKSAIYAALWLSSVGALVTRVVGEELPLVVREDFEKGADRWQPTDPQQWSIKPSADQAAAKPGSSAGHVYSQFVKKSAYQPPHRSPFNISILQEVAVSDFVFDARVLSTHEDYGHRDVCLVFGYQDPAHFYYVHLGKKTDDHADQIFIVNGAPRTKISTKTTPGTDWDTRWHRVRIGRRVASGDIAVFFDDMEHPIMTAVDKTFAWGRIGVGSFDDTSDWDDIELRGKRHELR